MYSYHFLINFLCFCKQRYDRAVQPQNMTFSQCTPREEKFSDSNKFLFNFYLNHLSYLK